MGQTINPLTPCESKSQCDDLGMEMDKRGDPTFNISSLHEFANPCGSDFVFADIETPPARKRKGVRRPLLSTSDVFSSDDGMTPLMIAAQFGAAERAERHVADGADLEARDNQGRTALHWAALEGNTSICLHLLQHGASLEAQDSDGCTPMQCAEQQHPSTAASMAGFQQKNWI
mmetsp:Transcript_14631/g.28813  ORF Transcript_14631/g.28813 Transcript_14631/m.28813 type:complete len:174 (-) Transcript_14631:36-557(-)